MRHHLQKPDTGSADLLHLPRNAADMRNPVIREVFAYWEGLRKGRLAPLRSELDPRKIGKVFDQVFMLEFNNAQDIRFRLAGMDLCQMLGMELRGMPLRALFSIGHRDQLARVIAEMAQAPEIVELALKTPVHNTPTLNARMLLLPMQDAQARFSRILGCLVSDDPPLQAPVRFDIVAVKTTRIVAAMAPAPSGRQKHSADNRQDAGAEPLATGNDPLSDAPPPCAKPEGLQQPPDRFDGFHRPVSVTKATTPRPVAGKPYLRLIKDR